MLSAARSLVRFKNAWCVVTLGPQTSLSPVFLSCPSTASNVTRGAESFYHLRLWTDWLLQVGADSMKLAGRRETPDNGSQDSNELQNSRNGDTRSNRVDGKFFSWKLSFHKTFYVSSSGIKTNPQLCIRTIRFQKHCCFAVGCWPRWGGAKENLAKQKKTAFHG